MRVFVTGSADGLGRAAAAELLDAGHDVVVHARSTARLRDLTDLLDRGASGVVGDLADAGQVRELAESVNALGAMDAVIHNAGVLNGRGIVPVNVVAPYVLTCLLRPPQRSIVLSSGMHRGGRAALDGIDWTGGRPTAGYSDSKLLVTTLAAALAARRPDRPTHAVDPGWVPTRMGGRGAPDDLVLGHRTQVWLATTDDPAARASGYWFHQRRQKPHPAVHDVDFQDQLVEALHDATGLELPAG
jgi:NAD(P)-dependent dehydrogenase (short-subunit alcohol dehydrogenase family)